MMTKRENLLPDYRFIVLFAGILYVCYLLMPIITPFLVSAILAYVCNPLVDRLEKLAFGKRRVGRSISALLVMLLLFTVIIVVLLIVIPLLQKEVLMLFERLPTYISTLRLRLDPWLMQHFGVSLAIDMAQIQDLITKHWASYWKSASNFAGQFLLIVSNSGLALLAMLANLLLIPIVLFYLLRDWHGIIARIALVLPRRYLAKTTTIAQEIDMVLAEFLRGQVSVMLLMSAFYAIGLWLAGLELALPIGLVAGLLGFVPYLGIGTGMLLAFFASALQFTSLNQCVPVIVVFGLGQMLESMLLTPWLVGDRIGLHPVMVIFILLAGGQLFGFSGILLALPLGAALAVGFKHVRASYLKSDLYLK
jgi:predicted PurR-regulated permease PerM